jgi:hypothetical protein
MGAAREAARGAVMRFGGRQVPPHGGGGAGGAGGIGTACAGPAAAARPDSLSLAGTGPGNGTRARLIGQSSTGAGPRLWRGGTQFGCRCGRGGHARPRAGRAAARRVRERAVGALSGPVRLGSAGRGFVRLRRGWGPKRCRDLCLGAKGARVRAPRWGRTQLGTRVWTAAASGRRAWQGCAGRRGSLPPPVGWRLDARVSSAGWGCAGVPRLRKRVLGWPGASNNRGT